MSLTTRLCSAPGCTAIEVDAPSGWRCPQHKRAKQWKPAPAYSTQRWRKLRDAFIAEHPRCARCPAPSEHAHHRDHVKPDDPRFWQWAQLEALCSHCHHVETGQQSVRVRRERAAKR